MNSARPNRPERSKVRARSSSFHRLASLRSPRNSNCSGRVVAGVGEDVAEQPGDRQAVLQSAPAAGGDAAPGRTRSRWSAGRRRPRARRRAAPPTSPSPVPAQDEQGLVAEAAERRAQRPGQADAVLRVLQGAEQVEQVVDLLLGEEGPAADEVVVQPVAAQGRLVEVRRCSSPGTAAPRRPPCTGRSRAARSSGRRRRLAGRSCAAMRRAMRVGLAAARLGDALLPAAGVHRNSTHGPGLTCGWCGRQRLVVGEVPGRAGR